MTSLTEDIAFARSTIQFKLQKLQLFIFSLWNAAKLLIVGRMNFQDSEALNKFGLLKFSNQTFFSYYHYFLIIQ
jgi:hypothetical protein